MGEAMNQTARQVLTKELECYVVFRKEKQSQVDTLRKDLATAEEHLKSYDVYMTEIQKALESDE